jgi:hypothetical protein
LREAFEKHNQQKKALEKKRNELDGASMINNYPYYKINNKKHHFEPQVLENKVWRN